MCTTGVEFELSWSFLPKFAGTVKIVAKVLVGMVSLCIFGLVQDWYSLIGSSVVWCDHVTCVFVANASYMAFIYMYIIHSCSYVIYNYLYIEHMCLCVVCVLHPLSTSFIRQALPGHT